MNFSKKCKEEIDASFILSKEDISCCVKLMIYVLFSFERIFLPEKEVLIKNYDMFL